MVKTTKAQRKALGNFYRRECEDNQRATMLGERKQRAYRDFRRTVQPMFCGDGAIVIPWAGMMLAIEPNGYAHT